MSHMKRLMLLATLTSGGSAVMACRSPNAPDPVDTSSAQVIVAGGERTPLALVEPDGSGVVIRLDEGWSSTGPFARSHDGGTLYFRAFSEAHGAELVSIDTRTLGIHWREPLSDARSQHVIRGVELWGGAGLAISPDGTRLFVAAAFRDAVPGVAVLDLATRAVVGFIGPLVVTSELVTYPPSAAAPHGAVLALGARTSDLRPNADSLLIIDLQTLEVQAATGLPDRASAAPRVRLWQVLPAPDGRHLYIVTSDGLFKYDVARQVVVATAVRPSLGTFAIAPDGEALYFTDPGDGFNEPGSGLLYVFGPDLIAREPIDLRAAAVNGLPPVTRRAVVAEDGATIYVTAGTPSHGPVYGSQPAQVLVVDLLTRRVRVAVALDDWGVGPIFVGEMP